MTSPALVRSSDLNRMAKIAKQQGVTVWIEIDGRKIGVSPNIPDNHRPLEVDQQELVRL